MTALEVTIIVTSLLVVDQIGGYIYRAVKRHQERKKMRAAVQHLQAHVQAILDGSADLLPGYPGDFKFRVHITKNGKTNSSPEIEPTSPPPQE